VRAYRISYVERELSGVGALPLQRYLGQTAGGGMVHHRPIRETLWHETVRGRTPAEALEAFLRDRLRDWSDLGVLEPGGARNLRGIEDIDPSLTYIWVEDGRLMEYRGVREATAGESATSPGAAACPLCAGAGEVPEVVADQYWED
jgi:hypothetical protein